MVRDVCVKRSTLRNPPNATSILCEICKREPEARQVGYFVSPLFPTHFLLTLMLNFSIGKCE